MSLKDMKKTRFQRMKSLIVHQVTDSDFVERSVLLDKISKQHALSMSERNTADQVLEVMIRRGLVTLSVETGTQLIALGDPNITITEVKKKKAKAFQGKKHRFIGNKKGKRSPAGSPSNKRDSRPSTGPTSGNRAGDKKKVKTFKNKKPQLKPVESEGKDEKKAPPPETSGNDDSDRKVLRGEILLGGSTAGPSGRQTN